MSEAEGSTNLMTDEVKSTVGKILELSKPGSNSEELEDQIGQFLSQPHSAETQGLIAYLALMISAHKLPLPLCQRLQDTYVSARMDSRLVDDVIVRVDFMESEIKEYFRFKHSDFDSVQPTPVNDKLGDLVIDLACKQTAANARHDLETAKHPEIVVEAYRDPQTQDPGVWMSYKGIHFDPSKLT